MISLNGRRRSELPQQAMYRPDDGGKQAGHTDGGNDGLGKAGIER